MNAEITRERRLAKRSVVSTVLLIPCVVGLYIQGPEEVAMVASIAFMVSYIFERLRLHRTITHLLDSNISA